MNGGSQGHDAADRRSRFQAAGMRASGGLVGGASYAIVHSALAHLLIRRWRLPRRRRRHIATLC